MKEESVRHREIKHLAKLIEDMQLPRLVTFADFIERYVDRRVGKYVGKSQNRAPSWLVTNVLAWLITKGDEGTLTVGDLGTLLIRSSHSLTRLIDILESVGFVERLRTCQDRRIVHVSITKSGLAFMRNYIGDLSGIEREITSCLSDSELETLKTAIRKLKTRMLKPIYIESDIVS